MSTRKLEEKEEQGTPKKQKVDAAEELSQAAKIAQEHSKTFERPADWPCADESLDIDLDLQDLPHASADTEWWYINGHLKNKEGKDFSYFASFFRIFKDRDENGAERYAHAVNWAVIDVEKKQYYCDPVIDRGTPALLKSQLEAGSYEVDPRLRKAFIEILDKGNVPLPDRMFEGDCKVSLDTLDIEMGNQTFKKQADGSYQVHCENPASKCSFDLNLKPKKKAIRQGHGGVVKIGVKADTMFYYFIPRNEATGSITVAGEKMEITGTGWYDHEFGGSKKTEEQKAEDKENAKSEGKAVVAYAWNWMSVQLDNGVDITATNLVQPKTNEVFDNFTVIIGPNSEREEHDMTLVGSNAWTSIRTTMKYFLTWQFNVPSADMYLTCEAAFDQQELITLIAKPAFWEGRIHVKGTYKGEVVTGTGFIERHGFAGLEKLDTFFKSISKQVIIEIEKVMPWKPTIDDVAFLMADEEEHIIEGLDVNTFLETMIKPVREIVDRGGKAWRSFAVLLCCDAVGGNSENLRHWLAMPELMHVGSLIVDDIQDVSETRRGGPCSHKLYGEDICMNAGSAAYFISLHILQKMTKNLTEETRVILYDMYFLMLTAGHAGQAFDIHGLEYLMDEVIESGDGEKLETAVCCTHLLKSGAPAGCLARMGAKVGGGKEEQIEALGLYFESIGIAFQIIDDVLNLRGLPGKTKGEDLEQGKITFPVAKAMSIKDKAGRQALWDILQTKPTGQANLDVINDLEACGALPASEEHAVKIVEDAWNRIDALLPDSFYKMMLRSFGWYVLQRHY